MVRGQALSSSAGFEPCSLFSLTAASATTTLMASTLSPVPVLHPGTVMLGSGPGLGVLRNGGSDAITTSSDPTICLILPDAGPGGGWVVHLVPLDGMAALVLVERAASPVSVTRVIVHFALPSGPYGLQCAPEGSAQGR